MTSQAKPPPTLERRLGLPLLTFYGVGTIVGGGFYALTGKVAGEAGMHAPLAFLATALIALPSALSFAELSSRYPVSAGEARYAFEAFRRRWLSALIGWMVIATGLVSAATLANAFAGFIQAMGAGLAEELLIALMVFALGLIAAWGIGESAVVAAAIAAVEIGGLVYILGAAGHHLGSLPARLPELVPAASAAQASGIFLGAYLAFYSFVGFEDMVNVAEEVKRPRTNLPIAILLSVGFTAVLYFAVSLVTVLAVPPAELAGSKSPLSLVLGPGSGAAGAITAIGALAGVNGALVQIVMAARVGYGLAKEGQAPGWLARVHPSTHTPVLATAAMSAVILALALWFPLVTLAKATSTILLLVYALVNLSLLRIKLRDPSPRRDGPSYPIAVPALGLVVSVGFVLFHAASML